MFTGIIEQIGKIKTIQGNRFVVSHGFEEPFEIGESIALNGMCATVVEFTSSTLSVDIIYESRQITSFGSAKIGDVLNLERAAKIGQRNSGHNVTGHIDTLGTIAKIEDVEDFWLVRVTILPELRKLLVHKGSVALEGISLTVSAVSELDSSDAWFEVSIIPHTWKNTTLNQRFEYAGVNIEFDILGKYALNLA
jgi:riboflavin synthase